MLLLLVSARLFVPFCRLTQPGPIFGQPDDAEPATRGAGSVLDVDASVAGVVGDLVLGVLGDDVAEVGDGGDKDKDVEERFMKQRLDHFNRQDSRTFSQRYFINRR